MDKKTAGIITYCTACGFSQGVFTDEVELRRKIAEQKTCKCGAEFGFLRDGRIWNLGWQVLVPTPDKKEEKVYEKGETYDFYRDVRDIIETTKTEVFLIDAYVDEEALDLYLDKIPNDVKIRILTNRPQGNFLAVAKKFKVKPKVAFEVRQSKDCHDRLFFIDDACWVTGQSVKDAGKKPTYLVKIESNELFRSVFEKLWGSAPTIV
jgi:hypothetical protein